MPAGQHTNLLWFKGPCLDHVQVQDSCCFARERVLTYDTWRFPTKFLGNLFELGGVKINFSKLANFNYNIIDDISKAKWIHAGHIHRMCDALDSLNLNVHTGIHVTWLVFYREK